MSSYLSRIPHLLLHASVRRSAASLIDFCILLLTAALLAALLRSLGPPVYPFSPTLGTTLFVLSVGYFGLLNSHITGGQTFGKWLLGLRVVNVRGRYISPGRSLLRSAGAALPLLLIDGSWSVRSEMVNVGAAPAVVGLYLHLFAYMWVALLFLLAVETSAISRMMHDFMAKTYVIRGETPAELLNSRMTWRRIGLMVLGAAMFVGLLEEWLWDRQLSFTLVRGATTLERELSETVRGAVLRKMYVARDTYADDPAYVEVALPPELIETPVEAANGVARALLAVYPGLEPHQELHVRVGLREPLARSLTHTFEETRHVGVWERRGQVNVPRVPTQEDISRTTEKP